MHNFGLKPLGAGIGLRHSHFSSILEQQPDVSWFEIISEDFLNQGGPAIKQFWEIAERYPIVAHGVCLSIGSTDPLNFDYLKNYRNFLSKINSPWASDHLCFTMIDHSNLNELIPLPFTEEAVNNVISRLRIVQEELQRPFLLENVTRYLTPSDREMNEIEFISRILDGANCGLLLDITNVYLNSIFHKFDPWEFIQALPIHRVGQIHIAGYEPDTSGNLIDSHDAPVPSEIWDLLEKTLSLTGPTSILVERDRQLPPLDVLLAEAQQAQVMMNRTCSKWA